MALPAIALTATNVSAETTDDPVAERSRSSPRRNMRSFSAMIAKVKQIATSAAAWSMYQSTSEADMWPSSAICRSRTIGGTPHRLVGSELGAGQIVVSTLSLIHI